MASLRNPPRVASPARALARQGAQRWLTCVVALLLPFVFSAHAAVLAYVPDQTGAVVAVLDVSTGAQIATVPVGAAPIGVAVAPNGRHVYVTLHNSDAVAVISTNTHAVQAQIPAGTKPTGVAVSPDGSRLYVSNYASASASGGGSQWVNGTLTVVDTLSRVAQASIFVGASPTGVAVSPDGSRVYVANSGAGTVSVISTTTNTVTATVTVGANPFGVAASPDGQRVYVANSGEATVSVINAATLAVTSVVRVGGHAMGVAVSDDSTRVVVSNPFDNSVAVINALTQTVVATTSAGIGLSPAGVSFAPGGTTALVANASAGTLSAVNAISGTAAPLAASGLGSPLSVGKFVATTPLCALNVSGDGAVSAASDGLLIVRYMFGFRGLALTQGIAGIGAGVNAATIEQNIAALNLDVDGDAAIHPTTDGLLLVRVLLSLTDTALIANARNGASPTARDAAQILQWITSTHGASCLL